VSDFQGKNQGSLFVFKVGAKDADRLEDFPALKEMVTALKEQPK